MEAGDKTRGKYAALICTSCFTDTVYFHLPPLSSDMKCVYGVSCYRQIEAKVSSHTFSCLVFVPCLSILQIMWPKVFRHHYQRSNITICANQEVPRSVMQQWNVSVPHKLRYLHTCSPCKVFIITHTKPFCSLPRLCLWWEFWFEADTGNERTAFIVLFLSLMTSAWVCQEVICWAVTLTHTHTHSALMIFIFQNIV